MLKDVAEIAVECVKHPTRKSIWSPKKKEYVCPKSEELAQYQSESEVAVVRGEAVALKPSINA